MEWSELLLAAAFALVSLGCVIVVPLGLPGLWAMLAIAAGLELIDAELLGTPGGVTPAQLRLDPTWAPLQGRPDFERLLPAVARRAAPGADPVTPSSERRVER